jgi:enamidase
MKTTAIINIGTLVSGDIQEPFLQADSLLIENDKIVAIGPSEAQVRTADQVIDANGMTLTPGIIDSHTHPALGDYTPRLNVVGWIEQYLHGGITSMISLGELHVPGRPRDPAGVKALAILASKCYRNVPRGSVKVLGGTVILEPGLVEDDFREMAREGVRAVKFIQAIPDRAEAVRFSKWAKQNGMRVMIHCGGTSLPGVPTTTAAGIVEVQPDVLAHLNGGCIALSNSDIDQLTRNTGWTIDLVRFGNPKALARIADMVVELGAHRRIILGTDTPTGNGVEPLGMLHLITHLASLTGIKAEEALCMATGNTARVYNLPTGIIEPGRAADIVLMDASVGSLTQNAIESFTAGDCPSVAMVMIDGDVVVGPSKISLPPRRTFSLTRRAQDSAACRSG